MSNSAPAFLGRIGSSVPSIRPQFPRNPSKRSSSSNPQSRSTLPAPAVLAFQLHRSIGSSNPSVGEESTDHPSSSPKQAIFVQQDGSTLHFAELGQEDPSAFVSHHSTCIAVDPSIHPSFAHSPSRAEVPSQCSADLVLLLRGGRHDRSVFGAHTRSHSLTRVG